jgi:hypothetical protein
MSLTHVDPHVSEIAMVWIQSGDLLMVWIQISPRLIQAHMVNTKQYIKSSSLMSKSFLHHGDVILLVPISMKITYEHVA